MTIRQVAGTHPVRQGEKRSGHLLGDHLGSTAITASSSGAKSAEIRYYPWGTERYNSGTTPTTYRFTGQRLEDYIKLYWYGSRWYDASTARFIQPDSIVQESQDPQVLDRYIYAGNNPIKYTDNSGHCWGIASELRGLPIYNITCQNLDMALSIVQNPYASLSEKALAGGYIAVEATAHAALALGTTALACSAIAPCVTTVEAALGIGTSVWSLDPLDRGWEIENLIGKGSLLRNLPGFPTIDRFENGIATSIKSIDLGANTYLNINTLTSTVHGHINDLASFTGAKYGGMNITNAMIEGRELILAIPGNASAEQMKALQQLVLDAMTQGINLIFQVIK